MGAQGFSISCCLWYFVGWIDNNPKPFFVNQNYLWALKVFPYHVFYFMFILCFRDHKLQVVFYGFQAFFQIPYYIQECGMCF
jgi:hypothetical protein